MVKYKKITPEQAFEIMSVEDNFILLDVRTEGEYREQRINGAVLIPDYEIKARAGYELPDESQIILIYCRSGRRSVYAAEYLVELGYKNVFEFGGIIDWPYVTVSG